MNYIKITDADYLPITDRKVLRAPAIGMLLLLAYMLVRVTLLPSASQEKPVEEVADVPHATALWQKGFETL